MTLLPPDFVEFLRLLNSHEVRYLVVGGYAVAHYGHPRATGDLDIWIERSEENAPRMVSVLRAFGFGQAQLNEALFVQPSKVIRMGVPPIRLEVHTDVTGLGFRGCFERRRIVEWSGVQVPLISIDDLKINKRAAGRYKDLDDLEHLPP